VRCVSTNYARRKKKLTGAAWCLLVPLMQKRINVRLADAMHAALAELAKREEATVAQIIRRAIRAYVWPQARKRAA